MSNAVKLLHDGNYDHPTDRPTNHSSVGQDHREVSLPIRAYYIGEEYSNNIRSFF